MYVDMEWWKQIRLEVLRGETSKREILRREGIHCKTLQKILSYSEPPGYQMNKQAFLKLYGYEPAHVSKII
ncbi:MAG: hypothetical protein HOC71_07865 [Candidatus Latescibacteria bacterium]|nr:hypothetical protein [Candidatus Latescibacterota bacterium]